MKLNRKQIFIPIALLIAAVAIIAFRHAPPASSAMPEFSPTQYHAQLAVAATEKSQPLRIRGTVKTESIYPIKNGGIGFILADEGDEIHATYLGKPSPLLRDGQAIVAQGIFNTIGVLEVTTLMEGK